VGEVGHRFDLGTDNPDTLEVDLHEYESMSEMAAHFVDEGMFGVIPAALQNYIDIDAIAYDLAMDYGQVTVDGINYIYRCG
jgi:S-adenosylmethionine synthetase